MYNVDSWELCIQSVFFSRVHHLNQDQIHFIAHGQKNVGFVTTAIWNLNEKSFILCNALCVTDIGRNGLKYELEASVVQVWL